MYKLSDRDFHGANISISRRVLLWLSKINSLKSKTNHKFKTTLLEFVITLNHSLNYSTRKWHSQESKNIFVKVFAGLDTTMKRVRVGRKRLGNAGMEWTQTHSRKLAANAGLLLSSSPVCQCTNNRQRGHQYTHWHYMYSHTVWVV
jgi:hypothetical protein